MAKILLVEDDNNLREIFEMRLKAEGYETATAGNGEEALVIAMKERPDLIIADVMMPKLSGFEMLETLRAAPEMASTKAIMMTALGQAEDRARGERLGVLKYLVKSQVTLEDFVRVVREIVQPDSAATGTPDTTGSPANSSDIQVNQESEAKMPEDTSTNPTAPAPGSDVGAAAPADNTQQTTEQEQSAVQNQINSFVDGATPTGNPAVADPSAAMPEPAADAPAAAPTTDGAASTSFGGEPAAPAAGTPPADTTGTPPPADTGPAEAPAAPSEPPASTGEATPTGNTL